MNEWHAEEEATGSKAVAHYQEETHEFLVIVTKGKYEKSETFKASHKPLFGIDLDDADMAAEIAERLLIKIEEDEAKAQ